MTGMSCFNRLTSIYCLGFFLGMLGLTCAISWAELTDYQAQRERLIVQISEDVRGTRRYIGKSTLDERVMRVLGVFEKDFTARSFN